MYSSKPFDDCTKFLSVLLINNKQPDILNENLHSVRSTFSQLMVVLHLLAFMFVAHVVKD